jgi:hypothetical protein
VGEYDVLQGIFGGMLTTKDLTQQAMMKESSGDYKAAKALYDEVSFLIFSLFFFF